MKLGAKISLSRRNLRIVKNLIKDFDFIEVYYTPHHIADSSIFELDTEWVVHCPQHESFVNLADDIQTDVKKVKNSIDFASRINSKYAIVHAGFIDVMKINDKDNFIEKVANNLINLREYADSKNVELLLENLPFRYPPHWLHLGSTPGEIEHILNKSKCSFILDLPHAYHSSVSHNMDYKQFIRELYRFNPKMFHLYDGIYGQEGDSHLPLGKGNLDIRFFLEFIKSEPVTLEIAPPTLKNYRECVSYLSKIST